MWSSFVYYLYHILFIYVFISQLNVPNSTPQCAEALEGVINVILIRPVEIFMLRAALRWSSVCLLVIMWCFGVAEWRPAGLFRSREEGEGPDRLAAAGLGSGAQPVTLLLLLFLFLLFLNLLLPDCGLKSDKNHWLSEREHTAVRGQNGANSRTTRTQKQMDGHWCCSPPLSWLSVCYLWYFCFFFSFFLFWCSHPSSTVDQMLPRCHKTSVCLKKKKVKKKKKKNSVLSGGELVVSTGRNK